MPYYWKKTGIVQPLNSGFTRNGVQYPRNFIINATEEQRTELGLVWRPAPVLKDTRFYRNHTQPDGTVVSTEIPVEEIKKRMLSAVKKTAGNLLKPTDWLAIREAETSKPMPEDWMDYRALVRSYSDAAEETINNADFAGLQEVKLKWPESPEQKAAREALEKKEKEPAEDSE